MTPGILVRWVLQRKKKRPWEQKKCRRKVTKPSWEERERSFHCSRTAASMQALTIKIERVNRRRRDPSSVSVVERNSQGTSRLDSARRPGKVMRGNKPSTHKSSSVSPPARMQLFVPWKPWEVWNRTLGGSKPEWKQPAGANFTTISEHHAQDRSSLLGAGAACGGWGGGGRRPG